MPNNFKLRGDYYVSKAGNDSNDGLTPDTPKRTIQAAITTAGTSVVRRIIIGAGVYNETIAINLATGSSILGDGYVVIDGLNYRSITFTTATQGSLSYYDIEFRNYNGSGSTMLSGVNRHDFYRCRFINCSYATTHSASFGNFAQVFWQCIFISCNFGTPTNLIFQFAYISCILINSYVVSTNTLFNCYVNSSSVVAYSNLSGAPAASAINYNNIQGTNIINYLASTATSGVIQDTYGRYYDLSIATSTGDGTIGNPYGRPYTNGTGFNFTNHRIAYPTYNVSSSAVDPGFNNILKQDFSLQSSSLMVGRANNFIDNIGGTYVATRVDASGSLFSGSNATTDNFVFNSGDYVISGSAVTGSVTSAPIFISSSAKVIQEIDYNGLLAFNKDTTAPTGSNVNVPDVLTYTSASNQPGANPDRLTYYMRWTTGSSQPVSDAQWENGGLWPAGSFNVFEWNTKPAVDFLGRGNGDQNFSSVNTPTFVKATWIQLRLSLRNDYLI